MNSPLTAYRTKTTVAANNPAKIRYGITVLGNTTSITSIPAPANNKIKSKVLSMIIRISEYPKLIDLV
ncbi:hypothetical protein D3C86_2006060 [compost metagenome]